MELHCDNRRMPGLPMIQGRCGRRDKVLASSAFNLDIVRVDDAVLTHGRRSDEPPVDSATASSRESGLAAAPGQ